MFIAKKIIASLLYPVPLCLELLLLGLLLLWLTRFKRAAKGLIAAGVVLLAVLSLSPVARLIAYPLESRYLPIQSVKAVADFRYVAVLGHGMVSDPWLPANSQISETALARLVEGIRLFRGIHGSRLILSGAPLFDSTSFAEGFARVAEMLGVSRQQMILVDDPKDTPEEAAAIARIVGDEPFLLVTSAAHMPRAVALFKKQGANPVPSPVDYRTAKGQGSAPWGYFPSAENLVTARDAWHEYLGMVWGRFTGLL